MATPENKRFIAGVIMTTLAICAFFLAQGATALIGATVLEKENPAPQRVRRRASGPASPLLMRHDPTIILKRNIFNSQLGDLTQVAVAETTLVDGELALEEGETVDRCASQLKLRGTAVVPGDFDRSLAVIVGADRKTAVYQGAAEVEGSRIRAIHADAVFLQSGPALCRLTMFVPPEEDPRAFQLPPTKSKEEQKKDTRKRKPAFDRNAGLSQKEIAEGIEKISETRYNVRRTLLNKVLDNAGKLIGIAAVSPKIENGKSIGMEIRGVRKDTLLEKLGVKNNDVLESVNGEPLSSPDAALGAYTTLRTADKFTLSVIRDGTPTELSYTLN